jgi:methionyl-tRNA synthetase
MVAIETIQTLILVLTILWTLPWKGIALWKSARNGQKIWFIALLIVNTLGLLEILYLIFWQKKAKKR